MKSGIHAQGQSSHLGHSRGEGGGVTGVKSVALGLREGVFKSGVVPLWWTFFSFDASRVENVGAVSLQKRNFLMELSRQESLSFMESLWAGVFLSFALVAIV